MPNARISEVVAALAANVRRIRQKRGLTQEQLAEAADLHSTYLQRIERGSVNPSIGSVVAVADALGVRVGDLLKAAKPAPRRPGRPKKKRPKASR